MSSILIKNGTLVTMDPANTIVRGDLLIRDERIAEIGDTDQTADTIIDASGCAVIPGFVQTHIHLCQTIFRGAADDLALIDWLKQRVWPMEAAHSAASIAASARLGIAELIKGGTTCALTMETVNHTAEVFKVVEETGFRATVGKCMMDKGDEVPSALQEQTDNSIDESVALLEEWHGRAGGRIRYCFAPRFAISCTRELLERVASLARARGVMVHTHASENRTECELVEQESGLRNVAYLDSLGLTGRHVALAHCVHLSTNEIGILKTSGTNVVHCPSSNLKLGSGIAPIAKLLEEGISVSLGADGAACVTTASICSLKCARRRCSRRPCTDRKFCPRAALFDSRPLMAHTRWVSTPRSAVLRLESEQMWQSYALSGCTLHLLRMLSLRSFIQRKQMTWIQ
jgi:5-methylthioadenosine/S-adenosylhomocysteine deaminase